MTPSQQTTSNSEQCEENTDPEPGEGTHCLRALAPSSTGISMYASGYEDDMNSNLLVLKR